jgi:hypothetical protein
MARRFDGLSPTTLRLRLKEEIPSLSESIFDNILEHKIDGEVFLSLNDENLCEIAPVLGDRLKIKRLISETLVKLDTPPSSTSPNTPSTVASEKYTSTPSLSRTWMSARRSLTDTTSADSVDDSPTPTPPSTLSSAVSSTDSEDDDSLPERCNKDVCEINHGEPSSPGGPKLDWAEGLALQTKFSTPTTKAIETGVLTKSARVEIVHSVATLMLMHTSRPTPHDLDI